MCLLSAVAPSGFSCACPYDYIPTENQTHCKRNMTSFICSLMHILYLNTSLSLAPPRLLFSVQSSNLIRRVNTDGQNLVTLYSTTHPRALDFDFQ